MTGERPHRRPDSDGATARGTADANFGITGRWDLTVAGERADGGRKFKSSALDYAA
jgi:hypothetical protein